jgi:hypothetical protein
MPGTPAAMHTSTASTTLGVRPPRAFRSVATLLTLTDRRVIALFHLVIWLSGRLKSTR